MSEIQSKRIEGVEMFYQEINIDGIEIVTPAVDEERLIFHVIQATEYDIFKHGWRDYTKCWRCGGYLFHANGSRAASGCPCSATVKHVGNGGVGGNLGTLVFFE